MKKQTHFASQYLAAAGISFVEKKEDDSHTNLGFNVTTGCLETHVLSKNNDCLLFCYKSFSLVWKSDTHNTSLPLDGVTHKEVVQWLTATAQKNLNKNYEYTFHYDLPYAITDDFTYQLDHPTELQRLLDLRILAQNSLQEVASNYKLTGPIRVWPHHFDTGGYEQLPNSDIAIGFGLAIPDSQCNDHYFYISGYKDGKSMSTANFDALASGDWKNNDFKGGILGASQANQDQVISFFQETMSSYTNSS